MKTITIIGGGASGTLLAINLFRKCDDAELTVNLVEKRPVIGQGVAFSTQHDVHLLNVPADKMGAYPEDPAHFYAWLRGSGYGFTATEFVPRRLFGEYLQFLLRTLSKNAPKNIFFRIVADEAAGIDAGGEKVEVLFSSGERLPSDAVVLAFGNFLQPNPNVENDDYVNSPMYFRDAWTPDLYERIGPDDPVLIIGTGLSMVDVVMRLAQRSHRGMIRAISTRGLLPGVHELGHTYEPFYDELRGLTRITDVMKVVRKHVGMAERNGSNWRAVIDSLRPFTQKIWMDLPIDERRYFMLHLSRYWNAARHRVPASAAAVLTNLIYEDKLEILSGRLKTIKPGLFEDLEIRYLSNGLDRGVNARVVINCIGSETNFEKIDSRLINDLLSKGLIRNDELSLGLDATPDGRIIGMTGEPSDKLFTLGTALKGILWESTAIPEIRMQASSLAERLITLKPKFVAD